MNARSSTLASMLLMAIVLWTAHHATGMEQSRTNNSPSIPESIEASPPKAFRTRSAEGIEAQLDETRELQDSALRQVPQLWGLRHYRSATTWLEENVGLNLGVAYTALGMLASDTVRGDPYSAAGDLDILGSWDVWGKQSGNQGTIAFNLRYRHAYTETAPFHFGANLGSLWSVTGGFTDSGFDITQFYLDQYFLEKRVGFRVGQVFQDFHFDTYSYTSSKLFFLNAAFSQNPAVAFPDFGVGFVTMIRPAEDWYVLTGAGDAQGRKLDAGFDEIVGADKAFAGVELGWIPSKGLFDGHRSSLFAWYAPAGADGQAPDGEGLSFTYEWKNPNADYGLFARYSWSGTSATSVRHLGTAGVVWQKPFDREFDRMGFALGWGAPSTSTIQKPTAPEFSNLTLRDQGVIEAFYRFQVTPLLQVTPDVQMLIQPSLNSDRGVVVIAGLRARLAL